MIKPKNIGTDAAFKKITSYCAYQERCHQEIKEKLYSYGLYNDEVGALIARLIEENYLNEERFAIAFAGGKFRMNGWGRQKIIQALKQKQVSTYCIKKGLSLIDGDDYLKKLEKLALKKQDSLKKEKNIYIQRKKIQVYLMQKGFETALIKEWQKNFENSNKQ